MKTNTFSSLFCAFSLALASSVSAQEPIPLETQLATMLAPLGYTNILHVALDNSDWWANWMTHESPGYADFIAAAATPHARCAFLYKINSNEWWHKMQFFYDWNENNVWHVQDSGTFSVGNGTIYTLSSGDVHNGNYFNLSEYYVTLCDLPDLVNHQMISGMFWNKESFEMYVIAPNERQILAVKATDAPATLNLGESAPVAGVVYDVVRGTEHPSIPVTFSSDACIALENGMARAVASGNSTLTFSAQDFDGNPISGTARITIPFPDQALYAEYASWEFDQTSSAWWLVVDWTKRDAIAKALDYPMTLIKIEYSNPSDHDIGSGHKFVINNDWYEMSGWLIYGAGANVTEWLALAKPYPVLENLVCNFADGLHLDRITVYHKQFGTKIFIR